MRKTLMMSAAALGLAIGAPAFAQTTTGQTTTGPGMATPPASSGSMSGSGSMSDNGSTGTTGTTGTAAVHHHWRHAARNAQTGAQVAQNGAVRPGHVPGVGDSEPASNQASNIDRADTRSTIAPRLPAPMAGANASPEQLLGVAQNALRRGRTGEAQEALERAETRALDRSTAQGNENMPAQGPFIQAIGQARRSLASHDVAQTQRDIQSAMGASSFAQNGAGNSGAGGGAMGGAGSPGMSGGMTGGGMAGASMSGGAMQGGSVGQAPAANSAYSGAAMAPGTNALSTTGATNGNAIGATNGGPAQANGIPGTPSGISGQQGANSGSGSGGSGAGGAGSGNSTR